MDILSNLIKVKKSVTRSISPENFTGEKVRRDGFRGEWKRGCA